MVGKGADEPEFNKAMFNGPVLKENDDLALIKTIRTKFAYSDSIIVLDNGLVLCKNSSIGEVYTLDLETEELRELTSI